MQSHRARSYCVSCRYLSQSSLRLEALYTNPWLTAMILLTGALQALITCVRRRRRRRGAYPSPRALPNP